MKNKNQKLLLSEPILVIEPDAVSCCGSTLENEKTIEYTKEMATYMLAGQIAPNILRKKIIKGLNLLDQQKTLIKEGHARINVLDYSSNSKKFWVNFLLEKSNDNFELDKLILFLRFSLQEEYLKYANRFPEFCVFMREVLLKKEINIFSGKDIYTSNVNSKLSRKDVRIVYVNNDIDILINDINIKTNEPIVFFDNIYEPLAYFILQSSKISNSILVEYLTKSGFTKEKSKKIINLASNLYEDINNHIKRKISSCADKTRSILKIEKEINYFGFFHRECCKRRFYADLVHDKNNLRNKVGNIVNYIRNEIVVKQEKCISCIFNNQDIYTNIKNQYNSGINIQCERGFCELKRNFVKLYSSIYMNDNLEIRNGSFSETTLKIVGEMKDIYDAYGYHIFDLLSLQNPEHIYEYYKVYGVLPFKNYVFSELKKILDINNYKILDNIDNCTIEAGNSRCHYKKHKDNLLLSIKEQIKNGKHLVDIDSFLIGIYIWDQKNILESKGSIFKIVDGIRSTKLENIMSKRHKCATVNSHETREKNTEIKQVKDYCNDCYIRVRESILSEGCTLLSIEEACKKHRPSRV